MTILRTLVSFAIPVLMLATLVDVTRARQENGADVRSKNVIGETAVEIAKRSSKEPSSSSDASDSSRNPSSGSSSIKMRWLLMASEEWNPKH